MALDVKFHFPDYTDQLDALRERISQELEAYRSWIHENQERLLREQLRRHRERHARVMPNRPLHLSQPTQQPSENSASRAYYFD